MVRLEVESPQQRGSTSGSSQPPVTTAPKTLKPPQAPICVTFTETPPHSTNINKNIFFQVWVYSSVVKHLPRRCKALDLIPEENNQCLEISTLQIFKFQGMYPKK